MSTLSALESFTPTEIPPAVSSVHLNEVFSGGAFTTVCLMHFKFPLKGLQASAFLLSHQCVEGGDGEDSQASQGSFGGPAGKREQALGVGQLSTLQAGQVAAHPKQIHVKPLQVLLPLLDLMGKKDCFYGWSNCEVYHFLLGEAGRRPGVDPGFSSSCDCLQMLVRS